jgi:ABC-2 type transport system ATP-binding protein
VGDFAIRTENLTFDFGSMRAVDNVTFDVPSGTVFGLLGHNGSGKSTIVRLLLGLLTPSHGRSQVLGMDPRADGETVRQQIGYLLEQSGLHDRLTAEENLEFHGRASDIATEARQARSVELLQAFDLWDRRMEPVAQWSRGMKQKLAVARALFHRPQLVILDEPTAGLDLASAASLYERLIDIATHEQITVFLTTHKLAEAEQVCNMVGVLRDGKLLAVGPTAELKAQAGMPTLEITGTGFDDNILALLARRREVASIHADGDHLTIELRERDAHSWPLINLLVESGADVEEVHKAWAGLEYLMQLPLQDNTLLTAS